MEKILKKYQDRLNDLSRRNRLIRLSRIVKKKTFDVAVLSYINKDLPAKVVNNIFIENKSINLVDINVKDKDEERILKDISYLKRDIDFLVKEKGVYSFYLGYPFIQGNFFEGSFFRAPLFLVPIMVEFNRSTQKVTLKPVPDSEIIINKTFFLAFNKYNKNYKNVNLEKLDELLGLEPQKMIEGAIGLFESLNLKVDLTKFKDKPLEPLAPLTKDQHPKDLQGKVEFLPLAILGEFSQINSALNNDYDELINTKISNDLSKLILKQESERDLEERFDDNKLIDSSEKDNFFITKPDISQEQVLCRAREGKGLVIHGPPGTGKSQVITNLIADNLLRNRQVLLVCEKRPALDVVKNRLAEKGLNKHCITVHDSQNDRNEIFKHISSVLDRYNEYALSPKENLGSEIDSKVNSIAEKFDGKLIELKEIIDLIHNKTEYGVSPYQLYRSSDRSYQPVLHIIADFKNITFNELNESAEKISKLAQKFYSYENKDFPLYLRKRFDVEFDDLKFKEEINNAVTIFETLEKILYTKEFKQDLNDIKIKSLKFEEIYKILPELNFLKSKQHTKFSRLFDPRWWALKKKYSKIIQKDKKNELQRSIQRWRLIEKALHKVKSSLSYFETVFKPEFNENIKSNILSFKTNLDLFRKIEKNFEDLDNVAIFDSSFSNLKDFEKQLVNSCYEAIPLKGKEMDKIWKKTIQNSFYLHWINKFEASNSLKSFSHITYDALRKELCELIDKKIEIIPKLIQVSFINKYSNLKWKDYDYDGRRKNYNHLRDLIHEVGKQRKRMPLRELFSVFHDKGLLDLFPCWMCSPETASSVFPLKKNLFDIVIFDEASQCKLERAIPAIIRSKRLIVAGDEKQLPPTNFFMASIDEEEGEEYEYDEKQLLEAESLLEHAKTVLPGKRLIYHYRSKHEELINFSNYAFYNKTLRVLPRNNLPKESPIEYNNVNGVWESGINKKEAAEVVKLTKQILLENKDKPTLGIITFNTYQKDLIEDLLEEQAKNDPVFGRILDQERDRKDGDAHIGLFVKNIETVQGDERDIIIFSISYGRDKTNKIQYRFGPLNGPHGPNRLNVAISRAKQKVYIINSFDPADFEYHGEFEGPKLLKKYLEYSKLVSENNIEAAMNKLEQLNEIKIDSIGFEEYDSDFEGEVADALKSLGYQVRTQVGCKGYKIDLAIPHPKNKNKFIVGIECDGASYHSSKSAKDRDIYRQGVLEGVGWKILRVWSRDWWKNQDVEIKRLDREIKKTL